MTGKVIAIDQQSNFVNVGCSIDVMHTLCADHHGTPHAVCYTAGFVGRQGSKSGGVGYEMEKAPTPRAGITCDVVYCIQGNCIDRADTASCNGKGVRGGVCYTLNTIDHHAVCYPIDSHPSDGRANIAEDGIVPTITEKIKKGSADGPLLLIKKDDQDLPT